MALTLRATDALRSLELDTIDARFSVRGAQDAPRDIVIVAIDDRTLSELGLSPSSIGSALRACSGAAPTAIIRA